MSKPKPTPPKRKRSRQPDVEAVETADWRDDAVRRERKRLGPGKEAAKLLNKQKKRG